MRQVDSYCELFFRFYDADKGKITVDGVDVRDLDVGDLRRSIAVVPQETPLFNSSIKHNIHYGNLDSDFSDVQRAAEAANLGPLLLTLPDGYETSSVGDRGLKLSGGEKQRVALARAILKDAPVCCFDEATSALGYGDGAGTAEIMAHLKSARPEPDDAGHCPSLVYGRRRGRDRGPGGGQSAEFLRNNRRQARAAQGTRCGRRKRRQKKNGRARYRGRTTSENADRGPQRSGSLAAWSVSRADGERGRRRTQALFEALVSKPLQSVRDIIPCDPHWSEMSLRAAGPRARFF